MRASPWVGEAGTGVKRESVTEVDGGSLGASTSTEFTWHPAITTKAEKMSRLTALFNETSLRLYCMDEPLV
jgi:hypothetical protein